MICLEVWNTSFCFVWRNFLFEHIKNRQLYLKHLVVFLVGVLLVIGLDQAIKLEILQLLTPSQTIQVFEGLIGFTLVFNTGAAFGMGSGLLVLFLALPLVVFVSSLGYVLFNKSSYSTILGIVLVCGGGLSNALDRVLIRSVIDFIQLQFIPFPVFNVADMCICVGACIALFSLMVNSGESSHAE